MRIRRAGGWAAAVAASFACAAAAEEAPKPVEAEVVAVVGEVTAKRPGQNEFAPVKAGDRLPEKAEISTGLNAECQIKLPTAVLKIEALTTTSIDKLQVRQAPAGEGKQAETSDTKVNLKFGTVKFKVQKGALKTDMQISTPRSTTAIAGTGGGVSSYGGQKDLIAKTDGSLFVRGEGTEDDIPDDGWLTSDGLSTMSLRVRRLYWRIYRLPGMTRPEQDGDVNGNDGGHFYFGRGSASSLSGSPGLDALNFGARSSLALPGPPTHP